VAKPSEPVAVRRSERQEREPQALAQAARLREMRRVWPQLETSQRPRF